MNTKTTEWWHGGVPGLRPGDLITAAMADVPGEEKAS